LQRYMHISPAAIESAIRLLDQPRSRKISWRYFASAWSRNGEVECV